MVAAAGTSRENQQFRISGLGLGDIDGLDGLIERGTRAVAVPGELDDAVVGLLRIEQGRLGLLLRLLGRRQCQLGHLAHPCFRLGNGSLGLDDARARLLVIKQDQRLPGLDHLPFGDRNGGHHSGDLAADVDPKRRLDMAAGHNRLHQLAPVCRVHDNARSQHQRGAKICSKADASHDHDDGPFH